MDSNGGTFANAEQAEKMMLKELPWLSPIGALTLGAVVAIVLALLLSRRRQGLVGWWVAASHVACALLAAWLWIDRGFRATMSGTIMIDGPTLVLAGIVGVGGALCIALARPVVAATDREGEFYAMVAFASLASLVLGAAGDAALLALALAATGLATFVMTGYLRESAKANEAAIKYYIFGTVSGAALVYGLTWWFGLAGSTSLVTIGEALPDAPLAAVVASTALVIAGLGYKAALVPFHFWTPDAYEGGPLPVAAYLSVIPKLAGLIAIARVLPSVLPADAANWSTVLAVLAAVTMTVGNLAALPQRNVVRLLAYSSIAQSGYLLMGVAAMSGSADGLPALLYYGVAYAVSNLAAFAVALVVQRERDSVDIEAFRSLGRSHPWWTAVLVLSFLSLLGLPPLAGFFGKLEVFKAAIDADQAWLAVVAVVNTVVSLYYYLRVLAIATLEPSLETRSAPQGAPTALAVAVVTGAAVVAVGIGAEPLLTLARDALPLKM